MSIESRLDVVFLGGLALREKQRQQAYRPIVGVHKWFARRPGTLFRGLLLAEFVDLPLPEAYYLPHRLHGLVVADPFMGGGGALLEANRLGCDVIGFDVNPLAWWLVREELEPIDLEAYEEVAGELIRHLEREIGALYRTRCEICGGEAVAKYFFWVKVAGCPSCGKETDLFPGRFVAFRGRHPRDVVVCRWCGGLNELDARESAACRLCHRPLDPGPSVRRGQAVCASCGRAFRYHPSPSAPRHRLFAIEYHCPRCAPWRSGRLFKRADDADLERYDEAARRLQRMEPRFIPDEEIPDGEETARLRRWGYRRWRDLFNARQLLGLELSARWIQGVRDSRLRRALITNFSDLLRFQNMLCRYDPRSLKSLDVFSVHGFPVALIQSEANLIGIAGRSGWIIGAGGWQNIVRKYRMAKRYASLPFEAAPDGRRVPISGERIEARHDGPPGRRARLECSDAREADLPPQSVDAVLTDPPYIGNIRYAELAEFCYVWLRRLASDDPTIASIPTALRPGEIGGDPKGLEEFAEGISAVFQRMARALKAGRPFAFTYHHSQPAAYHPVVMAILDAGLICTRVFPCPSEMRASIHIRRARSAQVDMVFVCRDARWARVPEEGDWMEEALRSLEDLERMGVRVREGDALNVAMAHLARRAIMRLRPGWDAGWPVAEKLARVARAVQALGEPSVLWRIRAARCAGERPPVQGELPLPL